MTQRTRLLGLGSGLALILLGACAAPEVPEEPAPPPPPPSPAEGACLAAVVESTGAGDVRVLGSQASGANTIVTVEVPGAEAPWACTVTPDGAVAAVTYAESEGAL
jgi:hypothetical protein